MQTKKYGDAYWENGYNKYNVTYGFENLSDMDIDNKKVWNLDDVDIVLEKIPKQKSENKNFLKLDLDIANE